MTFKKMAFVLHGLVTREARAKSLENVAGWRDVLETVKRLDVVQKYSHNWEELFEVMRDVEAMDVEPLYFTPSVFVQWEAENLGRVQKVLAVLEENWGEMTVEIDWSSMAEFIEERLLEPLDFGNKWTVQRHFSGVGLVIVELEGAMRCPGYDPWFFRER